MKIVLQILFFFLMLIKFCFAQWVQTDTSLRNTRCLAAKGSYLYAGTDESGNIFVSTDSGDSWNLVNSGLILETVFAITFSDQNVVAAGGVPRGFWGQIILSTDSGMSWSEVFAAGFPFFALVSNNNNIFAGYPSGMLYSSDSGITWDTVNIGLDLWVVSFAVSGSKTFAGTAGDGVLLTTDNGVSWTTVNNGLYSLYVGALAVSGTYIFAGTLAGIYRSSNDGTNWSAVNSGLPTDYIESFNDFEVVGTNIFASITFYDYTNYHRYNGIYLSTDFGEMWNNVSDGLPEEIGHIPALTANETYLFAANEIYLSQWAGVWRRPLSEMITDVDENISQLPEDYNLSQNYPNPFNPSTKIKYSISQTSKVQIKVFDVLGKEIATLVNEEKPAGTYELTWNAANLPSGVYFYQLRADNASTNPRHSFVETKKMLLLK